MTTKIKQRTLIHEDMDKLNAMLRDFSEMKPILNKLEASFYDLELGDLNNDIFQEILSKGTARIKREYLAKEEDQIKKAGITSTRLQKNMMNGADEVFEKFNTQVNKLKSFSATRYGMDNTPRLPKSYITSFERGGFAVLKAQREEILEEYCKTYLEGPEEHELYQEVQEFLMAAKKMKNHLKKLGYKYDGNIQSILNHFTTYKDGEPEIKPSSIRWAVSGQKEQIAARNRDRKYWNKVNDDLRPPHYSQL